MKVRSLAPWSPSKSHTPPQNVRSEGTTRLSLQASIGRRFSMGTFCGVLSFFKSTLMTLKSTLLKVFYT